jgi:L-threonylcarbamoyladenylate synthase
MTPPVDPNGNGNGTGSDGAPADLAAAADRIGDGDAVVYPTETVYGLGANALDPAAVEHVYELKRRPRSNPVSLAVPSVEAALEHVAPTDRERAFMDAVLPGPVTVVVERRPSVPDCLTAGRDRVGVRIPDHPVALALLDRVAPVALTATSANRSGEGSARRVADVDADLLAACATLDAGTTPGGESTVVDPSSGIIRRGRQADAVERWLDEHEDEDERERE